MIISTIYAGFIQDSVAFKKLMGSNKFTSDNQMEEIMKIQATKCRRRKSLRHEIQSKRLTEARVHEDDENRATALASAPGLL